MEHTTEAVLASSGKFRKFLRFRAGHVIESKAFIKYLSVMLDHRLTFKEDLTHAGEKTRKVVAELTGMMSNIRGPKQPSRMVLARLCSSILLYAAPVWTKALSVSYPQYIIRGALTVRNCPDAHPVVTKKSDFRPYGILE